MSSLHALISDQLDARGGPSGCAWACGWLSPAALSPTDCPRTPPRHPHPGRGLGSVRTSPPGSLLPGAWGCGGLWGAVGMLVPLTVGTVGKTCPGCSRWVLQMCALTHRPMKQTSHGRQDGLRPGQVTEGEGVCWLPQVGSEGQKGVRAHRSPPLAVNGC